MAYDDALKEVMRQSRLHLATYYRKKDEERRGKKPVCSTTEIANETPETLETHLDFYNWRHRKKK